MVSEMPPVKSGLDRDVGQLTSAQPQIDWRPDTLEQAAEKWTPRLRFSPVSVIL